MVEFGVPQGSILGPTLFNLYINDLHDFCINTKIIQFADDTCVLISEKSRDSLAKSITNAMNKINFWLMVNNLMLNVDKTKILEINLRNVVRDPLSIKSHCCVSPLIAEQSSIALRQPSQDDGVVDPRLSFFSLASSSFNVILNCCCPVVTEASNYIYLGVIFQQNLKWDLHVSKMIKKLRSSSVLLYKLRNVSTVHFRRAVYYSFIHSQLKYGILLYGATYHSTVNPIVVLQKKCLRNVYGMSYLDSTSQLWREKSMLHFYAIYAYSAVMYAMKWKIHIGKSSNNAYITRFAAKECFSHYLVKLAINNSLLSHRLVNIKKAHPDLFDVNLDSSSYLLIKHKTKEYLCKITPDSLKRCILL